MTDCQRDMPRVLLVGPMPAAISTAANPIGGAAVNFREMVRQLKRRRFQIEIVDISRPRVNLNAWSIWKSNISTFLRLIRQVLGRIGRNDVVFFNIASGRAWVLASCIWGICTMRGRPMALRFFGGDFADRYDSYTPVVRWWANRTYMRSALVYVQTQAILRRFQCRGNFRWFANTRDLPQRRGAPRTTVRRLLFVSQLRMKKGLRETLEACRALPEHVCLSVYGPRMPDTNFALFDGHARATYGGVLKPDEVPAVLEKHDVLVFPSYWDSEGHPGIILEALQCGVPVISTWWNSIPEVVEDERSGLLVAPRSSAAVKEAIERLIGDPEFYQRLCSGARRRGEFFRSGRWYDKIADELCDLGAERSRGRGGRQQGVKGRVAPRR